MHIHLTYLKLSRTLIVFGLNNRWGSLSVAVPMTLCSSTIETGRSCISEDWGRLSAEHSERSILRDTTSLILRDTTSLRMQNSYPPWRRQHCKDRRIPRRVENLWTGAYLMTIDDKRFTVFKFLKEWACIGIFGTWAWHHHVGLMK